MRHYRTARFTRAVATAGCIAPNERSRISTAWRYSGFALSNLPWKTAKSILLTKSWHILCHICGWRYFIRWCKWAWCLADKLGANRLESYKRPENNVFWLAPPKTFQRKGGPHALIWGLCGWPKEYGSYNLGLPHNYHTLQSWKIIGEYHISINQYRYEKGNAWMVLCKGNFISILDLGTTSKGYLHLWVG